MHTAENTCQINKLRYGSMSFATDNMVETGSENCKENFKMLNSNNTEMETEGDNSKDNELRPDVQSQQGENSNINTTKDKSIEMSDEATANRHAESDKGVYKQKPRKWRELGDLGDNHILSSRLRSSSGKVYSSSVSVEAGSSTSLGPVSEEENGSSNQIDEMCPKEDCCKGTNKLMEMMIKLQESVDGVLKKVTTQETISSNTSHRLMDLQEKVNKNEEGLDEMEKELTETKFQLQVVSNIVIKQDEQISFLKKED